MVQFFFKLFFVLFFPFLVYTVELRHSQAHSALASISYLGAIVWGEECVNMFASGCECGFKCCLHFILPVITARYPSQFLLLCHD